MLGMNPSCLTVTNHSLSHFCPILFQTMKFLYVVHGGRWSSENQIHVCLKSNTAHCVLGSTKQRGGCHGDPDGVIFVALRQTRFLSFLKCQEPNFPVFMAAEISANIFCRKYFLLTIVAVFYLKLRTGLSIN